jgi:hypothetical protein
MDHAKGIAIMEAIKELAGWCLTIAIFIFLAWLSGI